jgi:hypothetical protein
MDQIKYLEAVDISVRSTEEGGESWAGPADLQGGFEQDEGVGEPVTEGAIAVDVQHMVDLLGPFHLARVDPRAPRLE